MSSIIHANETWQSSLCLNHEEAAVGTIYTHLQELGYQITNAVSHTRSVWQRGSQFVAVSLVDDAWNCALDRSKDTPYLFDTNTTVITDNWFNTPTLYTVARVPDSFYGIYSYTPVDQAWKPDRDYTFAVNRVDLKRMQILLNLYRYVGLYRGYVNFNCAGDRDTNPKQNFSNHFIYATDQELLFFQQLIELMPLKNYAIDHDQTYVSSWLNVIVETYSSDNIISLSEKIFRCLVTPVPWIAYSGRYTIARLRCLGFDVLDDIIDHNYDHVVEAQHKTATFVNTANTTIDSLKQRDWSTLSTRCQAAATHNQQLLAEMKRTWTTDFEVWLNNRIA
jgi:hypothetical protein